MKPSHKPILRGTTYVCGDCNAFLFDVRTSARLRALKDVDPIRLAAVERRYRKDPELAVKLVEDDPREVVGAYKLADKLNDFLMNPKARPDLQTPEAQAFLKTLQRHYHNDKTDALMPWLTREWKKGRIKAPHPEAQYHMLQFDAGPDYEHVNHLGEREPFHRLSPESLNHWADWYGSNHPSRQGVDIMQMKTPDVHQTIRDWDTDMRDQAGGSAQTRGNIVHTYPDGWTVQQLTDPKQLEDEGEKMGHCVGSYARAVQNGESLIYSLRDHQNEPHATWEITPHRYQNDEDIGSKWAPAEWAAKRGAPIPEEGTMEQIQGKGNKPPIEDYQKRIKDYFETTMPDPKDRPQWDDHHYDDLDELMDQEGYHGYISYHPGDYGLKTPKTTFDWPSIIEKQHGWGEYNPEAVVQKALEHNQFPEMASAAEKDRQERRSERRDTLENEWDRHYSDEWRRGFHEQDPEPDPSDERYNQGDYNSNGYNKAWAEWQEREQAAEMDAQEEFLRQREVFGTDWDEGQYIDELETEIAAQRRRENQANKSPQQSLEASRHSSIRASHTHFTTGEPCYCTFLKHPESQWHEAAIPTCEACGDPLEHGKCKRCDWGGWSTAMGEENPPDPTRDVKPAIQA